MYKSVKKNKAIQIYIQELSLHTRIPTLHWEYNASCISVVEAKRVTPRVKHIDITVFFIQ